MTRAGAPWPDPDDVLSQEVNPDTGALHIEHADGSLTIDMDHGDDDALSGENDDDDNLAESLSESCLDGIASELIEAIDMDNDSRQQWLNDRASGLDLLGTKLEKAKAESSDGGSVSTVRAPLLLEAVLRSVANASAELLPSSGPVKVANDSDSYIGGNDSQAEALEKDLNHYLTKIATEYYPDTKRMLMWWAFGGAGFKKVYFCPMRNRPVSESVDAQHLIVSDTETDLSNCARITHEITMRPSILKRMQILGVYRDVDLGPPDEPTPNQVDRKVDQGQGVKPSQRVEDQDHTIWECYCELVIPGHEHKIDGKPSGLPLPYRVSIETTSRKILEIRSNADDEETGDGDNDQDDLPRARQRFVKFEYMQGFGFWPLGLLNILGNTTRAVTAAWRIIIDAGMFATHPSFLYIKPTGNQRQMQNNFRMAPGSGTPIEGGANGADIRSLVMPSPYRDPGVGFMQFVDTVVAAAKSVGGTADAPVGEGRADAPVGTTLANIEQATKIEAASHKNLHQAQGEELMLLKRLFKENPESLWRDNKKANLQDKQSVLAALENSDIQPQSDPNTPSQLHRKMKAMALQQVDKAYPGMLDSKQVVSIVLETLGYDAQSLLAPPQPPQQPPVDPAKMADIQLKGAMLDFNKSKLISDSADKAKDRASKENLELLQLARAVTDHPDGESEAENILRQLQPMPPPSYPGRLQ